MTDLNKALADIADMRGQMARGVIFRGYGPEALAATGALAGLAALAQDRWIADPILEIAAWLSLWAATAGLAVLIIGWKAIRRAREAHQRLASDMLKTAIAQFLPAGIAGVLTALVLRGYAPETLWMLPGLWQILLSLGISAACPSLPKPMIAVALWYLTTGLLCLAWAREAHALSPLAMGVPFLAGQCLSAILLRHAYRRDHGEP